MGAPVVNFPFDPELQLGSRLTGLVCPVCGDDQAFKFWIDSRRPMYCPDDPAMQAGGPRTITDVEQCPRNSSEAKARRKATVEWLRKNWPDSEPHSSVSPSSLGADGRAPPSSPSPKRALGGAPNSETR